MVSDTGYKSVEIFYQILPVCHRYVYHPYPCGNRGSGLIDNLQSCILPGESNRALFYLIVNITGGRVFLINQPEFNVFDFTPARSFQTLAEIADCGVSDTPTRTSEEKVKILINFLPVIAEDDEDKMKYLDANDVLTLPLRLITEEVVNRGFMSNVCS